MVTVERKELTMINKPDNVFLAIYASLAARTNSSRTTTMNALARNTGFSYREVVKACKFLENIGLGRFIKGSHGHKSRIEWSVDIVALSRTMVAL